MAEKTYKELWLELKKLRDTTEPRMDLLNDILQGEFVKGTYPIDGYVHFLISRKWNSWYPSFIDVRGGCYTFVTGKYPRDDAGKTENNPGVIVIDPGFDFLPILRELYNIEFRDIGTLIVSHFHSDHTAGLSEFITLCHEAEQKCKILLNETSFEFFKEYRGESIDIREISEGQGFELCSYENQGMRETIFMMATKAFHREIGERHKALSLTFNVKRRAVDPINEEPLKEENFNFGILGDTDGNKAYESQYSDFVTNLCTERNVLLLHLGTISNRRYGCGYAHLYEKGLVNLLDSINKLELQHKPDAFILSEFGLELGNEDSIARGLKPFGLTYNWRLFPFIAKYFEEAKGTPEKKRTEKLLAFRIFSKMAYMFIESLPATCSLAQSPQLCLAFPLLTLRKDFDLLVTKIKEILEDFSQKFMVGPAGDSVISGFRVKLPDSSEKYEWIMEKLDMSLKQKMVSDLARFVQAGNSSLTNNKVLQNFADCLFKWSVSFLSRIDADIRYAQDYDSVFEFAKKIEIIDPSLSKKLSPRFLFLENLILSLLLKHETENTKAPPSVSIAEKAEIPLQKLQQVLSKAFPNSNIIISDIGFNARLRSENCYVLTSDDKKWIDPESGWVDIRKIECRWENDKVSYFGKN